MMVNIATERVIPEGYSLINGVLVSHGCLDLLGPDPRQLRFEFPEWGIHKFIGGPDPLIEAFYEWLRSPKPKPKPGYDGNEYGDWSTTIQLYDHPEVCADPYGVGCKEEATGGYRGTWYKDIYHDLRELDAREKKALLEVVEVNNGCWPQWVAFEGLMGRCGDCCWVDA